MNRLMGRILAVTCVLLWIAGSLGARHTELERILSPVFLILPSLCTYNLFRNILFN